MEETLEQQPTQQQADQLATVPTAVAPARKTAKEVLKDYFTATRIAYIAIFTALSFAIRFLQFAILPAVSYLKFDFSDTFVLICGYSLGPVAGVVTLILKELLYGIVNTGTAFVGELANVLITLPMLLITSILYKKYKGIKAVIVGMVIACVVRVIWCFPVNWLLNFPVFVGFDWNKGMSMFIKAWYWVELFNLIKTAILAVVVMLLYKPLSKLIQLTSEKFDRRKKTA